MDFLKRLDETNTPHELIRFNKAVHSAYDVAEIAHCGLNKVMKTMVFIGREKPITAVVPGDRRVDMKKLRSTSGASSSLRMASPDEVLSISGYEIGSVSPLGLAEDMETYIDSSVASEDFVLVGSGEANSVLKIQVSDLLRLSRATVAEITTFV